MSSHHRNKRRGNKVSEHVQVVPENTFLPPGSQDTAEAATPTETSGGEAYPAVVIKDEAEHKAQEEKAAEERVQRAKAVSSPKRLSQQEMLNMTVLLTLLTEIHGQDCPLDSPIPIWTVPEEIRTPLFATGAKNNMAQRNLVKLIMNPETKQFDSLHITEIGFAVYQNKSSKGNRQPRQSNGQRAPRQRKVIETGDYIEFTPDLRLKKLQDNPRKEGTKGWYSWQLYKDGMNYQEYLATKNYPEGNVGFPEEWKTTKGMKFRGPSHADWTWDLDHKFTALYREGQEEKLPDGTDNPNYWVSHIKTAT